MGRVKLLFLCAVALPLLLEGGAAAGGVRVKVGQTVKVALPRQPQIIGIEDTSIASMKVEGDGHALVTGLRPGKTRIIGRDFAELPIIIPVTVTSAAK